MNIEPSQSHLKKQLRKDIRQRRSAIAPEQRENWNALINRNLEAYVRQHQPRQVAAFLAFDGEADILPALTVLAQLGVKLALPVVTDAPGKSVITMREWHPADALAPNRFGIAEPANSPEVHVTDIDLVLVPLVGWDRAGNRLGMGASFYDRLFQPFVERDRPTRMGVAYELQRVDSIPSEPWDIRLHGILTENGWSSCPF